MGRKGIKKIVFFSKIFILLIVIQFLMSFSAVAECPDIMPISPSTIPQGTVGSYYSVQFTASGGTAPYSFYAEVLPPGLSLTSSGLLSGTPTEAGEYSLYIGVQDSSTPYPCYGNASYILKISNPCPLIYLTPSQLPNANIGVFYSQNISAEGGVPPYYFSLGGGTLPPGISLSREGNISGTPTTSGTFNFLVLASDSANCYGSQSYSLTVGCQSNYGTLSGYVGIPANNGQSLFILDGDSVSGTITAKSTAGEVFTAAIERGAFSFGSLPAGNYTLSGVVNYKDNILYDAKLLSYGCAAPANSYLTKTTTLQSKSVEVKCDTSNMINYLVPPPVVMIHGSFDCYNKWVSTAYTEETSSTYFDNYARQIGFISFTPNYDWWNGSYFSMAEEVLEQIDKNFNGLSKSGTPSYYVITHDTGGLLLRVLGSDIFKKNSSVGKIQKAFLLAPPNSGYDFNLRFGKKKQAGENLITKSFNEAYPDFGKLNVLPIAGNNGWWGSKDNDGMVSLDSVFNIKNVSCIEDDCISYPSMKLPRSASQILPYKHNELGSPVSVYDVFNLILSNSEKGTPEAPVGAVGWGTTGVTSKKIGGGSGAQLVESSADYPFYVSKCDGIAIVVKLISGSGTFMFVDPNGIESVIENGLLIKSAPTSGNCFLRVIPDSGGVNFEATIIENSLFGIKAYLTSQNFLAGENAILRVDKSGDWTLVSNVEVGASLYDSDGSLLQTISLIENGNYFAGSFIAPSTVGSYTIVVEATGLYDNSQFTRYEFESMNVISNSHLFSSNFSDSPLDSDGKGRYDSISLSYSADLPQGGYFVVSGDLYDSLGNFVSHSSDSFFVESQGDYSSSLIFDISSIHCEQLSGKFSVIGLKILDGDSLSTIDVWNSPIQTKIYSSSQFECDSTPLLPSPSYLMPLKITKGATANVAVSGKNFKEGAVLTFESPISVLNFQRYSDRVIFASISVPQSAQSGYYDLFVKNPDGKSGKIENALLVSDDTPPEISFEYPQSGSKIGGLVNVAVRASDDLKVVSVSFELDGNVQKSVDSFPFVWTFDTSKTSEGTHILKAIAIDSSGQTTSVEQSVEVVRYPSITSITKKGDPFRLIVTGVNFQNGIEVYINNERWSNVVFKTSNKIVLKGGSSLKSKVPKGERTTFRFVNPDGGETTYIWQR